MMLTVDDLEACPGLAPTLRTLDAYARLDQAVMVRGMAQDLSWAGPAQAYLALYAQARAARAAAPRGLVA